MAKRSRMIQPTRTNHRVNSALDKNLIAYAAAAAGVAALAAPNAAAEIVYSPVQVELKPNSTYQIDLNHDGVNDFGLQLLQIYHSSMLLAVPDVVGNNVVKGTASIDAAALPLGAPIGSKQKFASKMTYSGFFMAIAGSYGSLTWFRGPWKDQVNKYLGFKFLIDGEVHYGWARLLVNNNMRLGSVRLGGYAYETVANKPIPAGKQSGADEKAAVEPFAPPASSLTSATLGMLAHGANGLAFWRREDQVV
ncbi:MAG TPA: hypothetical protein VND65_08905 [Candidatus Binatia bacterium]|nr:hypothetical protein [Candidatus Binatia bacterium]